MQNVCQYSRITANIANTFWILQNHWNMSAKRKCYLRPPLHIRKWKERIRHFHKYNVRYNLLYSYGSWSRRNMSALDCNCSSRYNTAFLHNRHNIVIHTHMLGLLQKCLNAKKRNVVIIKSPS